MPRPAAKTNLYRSEIGFVTQRCTRRRAGRKQGVAIEVLGHAVEYLIDSRMFLTQTPYTKSEEEAVQILMRANRLVFESCPEVVPMGARVRNWMRGMTGGVEA